MAKVTIESTPVFVLRLSRDEAKYLLDFIRMRDPSSLTEECDDVLRDIRLVLEDARV